MNEGAAFDWVTWLYLPLVGALGALSLVWTLRQLRRLRQRRTARVEGAERLAPVASDGPGINGGSTTRRQALSSIEHFFRTSRRVLVPSVVFFTAIGLAIPFLDDVPAAFLSLLVGALTVVIGVAARATLENMLAGLVLTFSRALNIGDTVLLDEQYGVIEEISMTHTTIKIWDWRRYVVPNRRMLDVEVINYTVQERFLWAQIEFYVAYGTDLALVERLAVEAAKASAAFAGSEDPRFWVMGLGERSIRCLVAAWAIGPAGAWDIKHDVRTALVREFAARGIRSHNNVIDGISDDMRNGTRDGTSGIGGTAGIGGMPPPNEGDPT